MKDSAEGSAARVLVTGGAGYVGSQVCKAVAASGSTPITFDNLSSGNLWAVRWGPLETGDLGDLHRLHEVMRKYRPVAIIHLAASALVGESVREPSLYYRNNLIGTVNLLDSARLHEVRHIVFSSSCATYGALDSLPITEDAPQRPVNPYGSSKLMVERVLADYDRAYGIRSAVLRYFNAAGADPDGDLGEMRVVETHLLPLALDAMLGVEPPLTLFGTDYPTPDGTAIRDYIHVTDVAHAHVTALRLLRRDDRSLVCNLGTGRGVSVRELVSSIERITGRRVPLQVAPRRPGDPAELVADCSRMSALLGLAPRSLQSLDRIIETAWSWHARTRARDGDDNAKVVKAWVDHSHRRD